MPQFDITSPDGRKFRITAPEGATKDQALAFAQSQYSEPKADPVQTAIDRSPTAGLADAGLSLVSGAIAAPVAGVAGLVQGAKNLIAPSQDETPAGDRVRQVLNAGTYEPRTIIGKGLTKAISYPFEKVAELGDAAGGAVADTKAGPAAGAAVNAFVQSVPMLLGRVKPGVRPEPKLLNTAAETARAADIAVPPSQANPTIWNKIVEGFAGKIKTAQDLSLKNQPKYNDMIREGLGLEQGTPLNTETLAAVRKEAGQAYESVRSSGRVTTDSAYGEALDKIAAPFERAAKDFPDAARTDVLDAVKGAKRDSFDASSAVDQIGILRGKADQAYRSGDKKLGGAYKDIAGAMEEQLGRHIEAADPQALEAFRGAREQIAKTYTVEKHLTPDGNVNMQGLAADLKRGKYMSGDIKDAARLAQSFPKASQLPEKIGGVPQSPWDHYVAGGTLLASIASGHPGAAVLAAAPYARPLLRNLIASDAYQNKFVNPNMGPSMLERLQELQSRPVVPLVEEAEGQRQ